MATITRKSLADNLQREFGLTGTDAYRAVDIFFSEIHESLKRGEEVKIANFGTFRILHKNPRVGRNPRTGEEKVISARDVVSFKSSADFRSKMKSSSRSEPRV
ncbi:MAG: integration host factor subunit alpha [Rickettsiales bacterium]|jgi:integration host factor subunit alpha|nr:integration host factor subunit alpha [Rickettsiales bacterium]